jgi:hypothetical protein
MADKICIIRVLGRLRADKIGGMPAGTLASAISTDKPKKLLDRVRDALRVKPAVSNIFTRHF